MISGVEPQKRDALIGVSMTGIASGAVLELDMKEAAKCVKEGKRKSRRIAWHQASSKNNLCKASRH